MKRILTLLLIASAVLLLACGDESEATSTSTGTQSPTPTVTTADATSTTTETPIPDPSETVTATYFTPTSELPLVRFITEDGPVELRVEVPARSEYAIGLSGRTTLEGRGMVFYREDFGQTGFWMRNTHINLDIAFVDSIGRIVFITTMLADTDDIHRPDAPYVAAIEVPAGWYAEHGVKVDDQVEYLFDLEATVTD